MWIKIVSIWRSLGSSNFLGMQRAVVGTGCEYYDSCKISNRDSVEAHGFSWIFMGLASSRHRCSFVRIDRRILVWTSSACVRVNFTVFQLRENFLYLYAIILYFRVQCSSLQYNVCLCGECDTALCINIYYVYKLYRDVRILFESRLVLSDGSQQSGRC